MARTLLNVNKRFAIDLSVFAKRIAQLATLGMALTLLLSPPSENMDAGRFLALFAQRLFGVPLTSGEGLAALVAGLAAAYGAYRIYPVLLAVECYEAGELNAREFSARVDKEQGRLRVFAGAAAVTAVAYAGAALALPSGALELAACGFAGLSILALGSLAHATLKVSRCEAHAAQGYSALAQRAVAKHGRLRCADLAKLLLIVGVR